MATSAVLAMVVPDTVPWTSNRRIPLRPEPVTSQSMMRRSLHCSKTTRALFSGSGRPLPENSALVVFEQCSDLRIMDCEVTGSGRSGIRLFEVQGTVSGTTIAKTADVAIYSLDARGLTIQNNIVRGAGNGGILVHRSKKSDDGTLVLDNRIEDINNLAGGSGQYGNAINVFRAGNVIVGGNRISRAAYSAVRGNAAP